MKGTSFIRIVVGFVLLAAPLWAEPSYSPHKYQQNDWFGEFGENVSMYVNPAGIAENDQLEVSVGMFKTISGEAGQEFISVAYPYDYKHSYGFTAFENGATIDNGESYLENAYMFGYAYRIMHALALGIDLAVLQVNQFDANKQITMGVDVGLSWNPISTSKLGHIQIGLAMQNAIQPAISTDVSTGANYRPVLFTEKNAYKIPSNLNLSFFYRGLNRMLEAKAEFAWIDVIHEKSEGGKAMNLESSFTATYYLSHLLGVRVRFTKEGYPVLGATVNVKDVNLFRYLELDLEMSHDDIVEKKNRGFIWSSKLTSRFGPTREESIGLRRYRRLKIEPEDDYRRAMRLYLNRQFLEAAYAFGKVITKYPSFHLVDQAAFYKGKSFENMRMHKASRKVYEMAIKKYPHSDQRAKYYFQLMNIDYKEGKFADALIKYQNISQKYAETDIKADADYIAGQIHFEQGQYAEAVELLVPILPGNANYLYARFTCGISYSRMDKWTEAEASFQDIINFQAANKSEADLQDAAKVKLGHIYFGAEPPELVKASGLYKQIQPSSHIFDEAVLALAWSFIKVYKPDQALKFVNIIIEGMPDSYMLPEAYLVKGYCYFLKKKKGPAMKALDNCIKRVEKPLISRVARDSANTEYEKMVSNFEGVQMKALNLARQLPTPRVQSKRDRLRPDFDDANKRIDMHYKFLQRALQSDRFEKNRTRILEDAEFTKATLSTWSDGDGDSGLDDLEDLE